MCVLANLEYLSVLFCAVLWTGAPGFVAVLPMYYQHMMQQYTHTYTCTLQPFASELRG